MIVLFKEDLTLPFEFLKIVEKRWVDLLDPIDYDCNINIVRSRSFFHKQIDVIRDSFKCPLQHRLVLAVHADADSQLGSLRLLKERNIVVLMVGSQLLESGLFIDFLNRA